MTPDQRAVIQAAVDHEREECAKLADAWLTFFSSEHKEDLVMRSWGLTAARDIANAIRYRAARDALAKLLEDGEA